MEFTCILAAGRWLAKAHPEITNPSQWTHALAQEYVAAVDQATVGGWSANPKKKSPEAKFDATDVQSGQRLDRPVLFLPS